MKQIQLILLLLGTWQPFFAQEKGIINNAETPYMNLKSLDASDCSWTEGFWADRLRLAHEVMVPNLGQLMEDPEIIHAYENFKIAAGLAEGEFKGWAFHDGDFYKYIEALAFTYDETKDEKINERMDEIIKVIGQAQEEDGYIHTMKQIGHGVQGFHHSSEKKFKKEGTPFIRGSEHEFYNFGHLMTAACAHYRITGKRNFLDIAIKASDLIYERFHIPSSELAAIDWNPPHYMGLVEMYRTTGEKKYLELAETFVNMLGTERATRGMHRGLDHSQKRTPIRQETEAVGHAGHGNYLYSGVADVYSETGDSSLILALERIWENIVYKKMYVTGAVGPHHFTLSKNRDVVAEAYGKNYDLPNIGAYNETCANIGNAMWNWRMFMLKGEAKFMDIMELIIYNSALSGIGVAGKDFFYTNPLRHLDGHPNNTKDEGLRSPFMSVFCCPPNIIRTLTQIHGYAYNTSKNRLWINLYGSNSLDTELEDGSRVKLIQETNYPWDGLVNIKVAASQKKEFSLMLRIPSWAEGAELRINGKEVVAKVRPGSYVELPRMWAPGDIVELRLPMQAQLLSADPNIEGTRNQVAVKRGPLVYCLESVDLPVDLDIMDIIIPQDIALTARHEDELLSGITVLEGEAAFVSKRDWTHQPYKLLGKQKLGKTNIRLIPYFAWSNRGKTDMTVWMPLKY